MDDSSRRFTVMVATQSPSEVTVHIRLMLEAALSAEAGIHRQPASRRITVSRERIRFKQIPPFIYITTNYFTMKTGKMQGNKDFNMIVL